jgi:hypothetical protein
MNEIDHFNVFVLYNSDVDHLHIKRIHLVCFSYIVIEDTYLFYLILYNSSKLFNVIK